jgi:hypothetical protein
LDAEVLAAVLVDGVGKNKQEKEKCLRSSLLTRLFPFAPPLSPHHGTLRFKF